MNKTTVRVRLDGSTQSQDSFYLIKDNYVDIEYEYQYVEKEYTLE